MKKDTRKMKKALKELIDKNNDRERLGSICMIAYHPSMARDIGKPRLGGDRCVKLVGKE